ncbi:MAG: chromosome segregation protein SMC [Cytophagales bacterium]|nr:MAG: chromosome segregation protein SMC [Cytophagales bacterium]
MRISSVHLNNFKRFTDLKIEAIPESSKLVLLIGSNGSGKSSVFDAFDWLSKGQSKPLLYGNNFLDYYRKSADTTPFVKVELAGGQIIERAVFYDIVPGHELAKRFIGRSSIRIVPKIENTATTNLAAISTDDDAPLTFIENDTRFINDVLVYIQELNNAIRRPIFEGKQADVLKIFQDFIAPLNNSLLTIFGGTEKTTIQIVEFQDITPNSTAKLIFKKGDSKIDYDLLSHGEKQVVILLLNFIVRKKHFEDTILFIDEMDCHLNTALQEKLLEEIVTTWIPDSSQLWTASHALGFIKYAQKSEQASIIDLNLLDFDVSQIRFPEPKDNPDIYDIAVGKELLEELFTGYEIVFVERNDKDYYGQVGIHKTLFVPERDRNAVYHKVKTSQYKGIVDRDFLSDDDITQLRSRFPTLLILEYYSIENYLFHPDNLSVYHQERGNHFDRTHYIEQLTASKNLIKDDLILGIVSNRGSYAYFKEPEYSGTALQKRFLNNSENLDQARQIQLSLNSNEFETFYKSLPMKDYCKELPQRQNISKTLLAKTSWFKQKIRVLLES